MKQINITGYGVNNQNQTIQFNYMNPTENILSLILKNSTQCTKGLIELRIIPEPEYGTFELIIEYESSYYLPLLNQYMSNGEINVKNWIELNNSKQDNIEIGGYFYPAEYTTKSIEVINYLLMTFIQDINLLDEIMK